MSDQQRSKAAELQERAEILFGSAPSDDRSRLIGMYQGMVQALRPLTKDVIYGATVEDYALRLIEELLNQAEVTLTGQAHHEGG